jgi:mRNA interferase MazF
MVRRNQSVARTQADVLRGEVYWVNLDPTIGTEIQKTRPALVVSPNDLNSALPRVIIAPLTSKGQALGCRPEVMFKGREARILLDQIRSIDKLRLTSKLGEIAESLWHPVMLEMLD